MENQENPLRPNPAGKWNGKKAKTMSYQNRSIISVIFPYEAKTIAVSSGTFTILGMNRE